MTEKTLSYYTWTGIAPKPSAPLLSSYYPYYKNGEWRIMCTVTMTHSNYSPYVRVTITRQFGRFVLSEQHIGLNPVWPIDSAKLRWLLALMQEEGLTVRLSANRIVLSASMWGCK